MGETITRRGTESAIMGLAIGPGATLGDGASA
jgi:hypothetical protein